MLNGIYIGYGDTINSHPKRRRKKQTWKDDAMQLQASSAMFPRAVFGWE